MWPYIIIIIIFTKLDEKKASSEESFIIIYSSFLLATLIPDRSLNLQFPMEAYWAHNLWFFSNQLVPPHIRYRKCYSFSLSFLKTWISKKFFLVIKIVTWSGHGFISLVINMTISTDLSPSGFCPTTRQRFGSDIYACMKVWRVISR